MARQPPNRMPMWKRPENSSGSYAPAELQQLLRKSPPSPSRDWMPGTALSRLVSSQPLPPTEVETVGVETEVQPMVEVEMEERPAST